MARRRKKSAHGKKPPLTFTESPVNIQNNAPSPVECARHPPTAASIPVDQLDNLSWVSPQFLATAGSRSHKRHNPRQRKLRPRGLASATVNKNTSSSHAESNRNRLSKFRSLKFVGDPSTIIASDSEDVDITESGQDEIAEENAASPSPLCTNKRKTRLRQKFGKRLKEISCNIVSDDDCDDATEVETEDTVDSTGHHEADDSSVIEFTCVKRFRKGEAPVKRLFASQLLSRSSLHSASLNKSTLNKENCPGAEQDVAFPDLDSDIETVPNTESDSDTAANAGVRRSERLKMLQRLMQSSDSPLSKENVNILAPDTPESCYGWSIRRQQLKNYKRKR